MSEASSKLYEIRRHEMQPYFDLEAFHVHEQGNAPLAVRFLSLVGLPGANGCRN